MWRAVRVSGREREAVLQAAKMAIAAVLAWLLTRLLPSPQSFIAPYAAVFLIAGTVYRSLANAITQTVTVMLGLVLAYLAFSALPWQPVALGVAVFVGMLVGSWHRLGANGMWVGVTALLMITAGTADHGHYLLERLAETAVGAVVGLAVNVLLLPPVHLRGARHAVRSLAGEIDELLQSLAADFDSDWDADTAWTWLHRASALDDAVRKAEDALSRGHESVRFNPRLLLHPGMRRPAPEPSLRVLREVSRQVQRITEALATASLDEDEFDPEFLAGLGSLLEQLAKAMSYYERSLDERGALPDLLDTLHFEQCELSGRVRRHRAGPAAQQAEDAVMLSVSRMVRVLAGDSPAMR
ncbi:FUSC family protein [Amycolatopsis sp. K13G38]|uniref:FUSC family protein n=1 Tax=Amycolatopsis acididurans TaxID=2724524 RepID=A0ABX1JGQ1_9PSEU|nr:FUSC family protein [Amycolatopsis acididurans]